MARESVDGGESQCTQRACAIECAGDVGKRDEEHEHVRWPHTFALLVAHEARPECSRWYDGAGEEEQCGQRRRGSVIQYQDGAALLELDALGKEHKAHG